MLAFVALLGVVFRQFDSAAHASLSGRTTNNRRILMQQHHLEESTDKKHSIDFKVISPESENSTSDHKTVDLLTEDAGVENSRIPPSINPVVLNKQSIKIYKAKGQGSVIWYSVHYQKARFLVVESGLNKPARIVSPNGAILDIHSTRARKYPELKNIWGTVILADGTHYSFNDALWNQAIAMEPSQESVSPAVTFQSGNIINANSVAFGLSIKSQIISVQDKSQATDLLVKAETEGKTLTGDVSTSLLGFQVLDLKSFSSGSKTDRFRVCVFCLQSEIVARVSGVPLTGGKKEKPAKGKKEKPAKGKEGPSTHDDFETLPEDELSVKDLENLSNPEVVSKLEDFFWTNQHDLPRIVFVDNKYHEHQYFLVPVQDGTYISFEPEDLAMLVELESKNKLLKPWLTPVEADSLTSDAHFAPVVVYDDKAYELNTNIARDYSFHDASSYEPEFAAFKSNEIQIGETDYNKMVIKNKNLKVWFMEDKALPGLFLRSTSSIGSRGWPFVLHLEDNVVMKYFLNVDLIKTVLTTPEKDLPSKRLVNIAQFVNSHRDDFSFDILDSNEKFEYMSWNHMMYQGQELFLTAKCLEAFYSLNVEGMFVYTDPSVHVNLLPTQKFVRVDSKTYIFNFGVLASRVEQDQVSDPVANVTVRRCLNLATFSHDTEAVRNITITQAKYLLGKCDGDFINETICKGTFTGDYFHCTRPGAVRPCEETDDSFVCRGEMSTNGCEGSVEGKFVVNGTTYDMKSEQSFSLVQDGTMGFTTLDFKNDTATISIKCQKNYNIMSQDCENAELTKAFDEGGFVTRMSLTCGGTLRLTKLDCSDSLLEVATCIDLPSNTDPKVCTNTYYKRVCHKGGDFSNCYLHEADDVIIDCNGGFYDGKECYARDKFVLIDEKRYFGSKDCQGNYNEGVSCDGAFDGYLVECPEKVDVARLCGLSNAKDTIFCNGTLTKNGCEGRWRATTPVNGTSLNFSVAANDTTAPIAINVYKKSKVTLKLENNDNPYLEDKFNWIDATVVCEDGYDASTSDCNHAEFKGASKNGTERNYIDIQCAGTLNLGTLECKDTPVVIHNCTTDSLINPLPSCSGDYTQRRCANGGGPFTCLAETIESREIRCKKANWNGNICLEKDAIIVLSDHSYVTGVCNGIYTEFTSCEGELIGEVVTCPQTYFTADITCRAPAIHKFTCHGFADDTGCKGKFRGMAIARGDFLNVDVDKNGHSTYFKTITGDTTTLTFASNVKKQKGIAIQTDRDLNGKCYESYIGLKRECVDANVNITQQNHPNLTQIHARCKGALNLNSLNCSGGSYYLASCTSGDKQPWTDHTKCVGQYLYLECANGGRRKNCTNSTNGDKQFECDGFFKNGYCTPFVPPQLPIIKVNSSYYIKGSCSSKIHENSCVGKFRGREVVTCKGDPLHKRSDYDACVPIPGEVFGNCSGVISGNGCKGTYRQVIHYKDETWVLRTRGKVHYDTVFLMGNSRAIKRRTNETQSLTMQLFCYHRFNPRTMECLRGLYRQVDVMPPGNKPGLFLTTAYVCDKAVLDIHDKFSCRGEPFRYYNCLGKSHFYVEPVTFIRRYTCLGNLNYASCSQGGNENGCFNPGPSDFKKECINSYFNGTMCLKDKPSENTDLIINDLGRQRVVDVDGQEVIIRTFSIDEFTMNGGWSTKSSISDSVLDKVEFTLGKRNTDGSFEGLDLPQSRTPMYIDEGKLNQIEFTDFQLDELPYVKFCGDDEAKIVKVTFKSLRITEFFLEKASLSNIVIQELKLKNQTWKNYGADNLNLAVGYGEIFLRDVTVYLPYIKLDTIQQWETSLDNRRISASIAIPRVEGVEIPIYKLKFTGSNTLFIEFPQLILENRSLDMLAVDDYIMDNDRFTSNPSAAELIVRNYEEWLKNSSPNDRAKPSRNN